VSKYKELHLDVIPPPVRERPANRWISDKTWAAVDKRALMRRKGHLTTYYVRRMGHEIKSLLAADCKQHAVNAASTVESHLSNGAVKEAWQALKRVVQVGGGPTSTRVSQDHGQTDGRACGIVRKSSPHGGSPPV
jgi:hypothetical protein